MRETHTLTLVHVVDADQPDRLIASDRALASDLLGETVGTLQRQDGLASDLLGETVGTLQRQDGLEAAWVVAIDDVHAGIEAAAEKVGAELVVIGPHRRRMRDVFVGTTAERMVQQSRFPLLVAVEPPAADYRRTLLALDFDDASEEAGCRAVAMGVFDHTHVVVMHAFDAPGETMMRRALEDSDAVEGYVADEREIAAARLKSLLEQLRLPPTSQTVVPMKGTPARSILETAQEYSVDLIAVGTNQRGAFERALVGSVTGDVIREMERDVLVIPASASE